MSLLPRRSQKLLKMIWISTTRSARAILTPDSSSPRELDCTPRYAVSLADTWRVYVCEIDEGIGESTSSLMPRYDAMRGQYNRSIGATVDHPRDRWTNRHQCGCAACPRVEECHHDDARAVRGQRGEARLREEASATARLQDDQSDGDATACGRGRPRTPRPTRWMTCELHTSRERERDREQGKSTRAHESESVHRDDVECEVARESRMADPSAIQ